MVEQAVAELITLQAAGVALVLAQTLLVRALAAALGAVKEVMDLQPMVLVSVLV
jgi:hypothetical protein